MNAWAGTGPAVSEGSGVSGRSREAAFSEAWKVLERLASLYRPPGSDGEARAAQLIADELQARGARTRIEPELGAFAASTSGCFYPAVAKVRLPLAQALRRASAALMAGHRAAPRARRRAEAGGRRVPIERRPLTPRRPWARCRAARGDVNRVSSCSEASRPPRARERPAPCSPREERVRYRPARRSPTRQPTSATC